MTQIEIGQRVRVIDGGLMEYKQLGTVMEAATSDSWYVHLDDEQHLETQLFFQTEELEIVQEPLGLDARDGEDHPLETTLRAA